MSLAISLSDFGVVEDHHLCLHKVILPYNMAEYGCLFLYLTFEWFNIISSIKIIKLVNFEEKAKPLRSVGQPDLLTVVTINRKQLLSFIKQQFTKKYIILVSITDNQHTK